MTKEGEESQAKDSSAEKEQGEQEMQEQVKQQVMEKEQVVEKVQVQEVEEGVEVRREDCYVVMTKVGEQTSEVGLNQYDVLLRKQVLKNLMCLRSINF